jgi:DNA-binding transcriptional LysR family regulator
MDNLDRLRVFYAVAGAGSFTDAAESLHLTQPGVSKHIRHMEEELGAPLFDRLGKTIALTQAGEILYHAAKEVIGSVAAAEQRIQDLAGLHAGRLRVGASFPVGLYVLPRVLAAFRKDHSAIDVILAISTTAKIEAKVLDNQIDLGLISAETQNPKLMSFAFMTDELVVIVPADHKWSSRRNVKALDLTEETFILAARGAGARAVVEERLKEKGIVLTNVLDFVNAEGVKHAVEAGLGVSIQPRGIVRREIEAGSLNAIRLADMDPEIEYVFIRRRDRHLSNAEKAFLTTLKSEADALKW